MRAATQVADRVPYRDRQSGGQVVAKATAALATTPVRTDILNSTLPPCKTWLRRKATWLTLT